MKIRDPCPSPLKKKNRGKIYKGFENGVVSYPLFSLSTHAPLRIASVTFWMGEKLPLGLGKDFQKSSPCSHCHADRGQELALSQARVEDRRPKHPRAVLTVGIWGFVVFHF